MIRNVSTTFWHLGVYTHYVTAFSYELNKEKKLVVITEECSSSCLIMLTQLNHFEVLPKSKVGIHCEYYITPFGFGKRVMCDRTATQIATATGVKKEFIKGYLDDSRHNTIYYLTPQDLWLFFMAKRMAKEMKK